MRSLDLGHIEVEDHYLRLHTNLGSDLILLGLSDAIGELDQAIGRQCTARIGCLGTPWPQ
jgi:hypothetical protein